MSQRRFTKLWFFLFVCLFWGIGPALSEEEPVDKFPDLTGREIDLWLDNDTYLENVTAVTCNRSKDEAGLKSLTYRPSGSKKIVSANPAKIKEILCDNLPLDVEFDTKTKLLVVSATKRAQRLEERAEITKRLTTRGHRMFETLDDQETQQEQQKLKDHVKEVQAAFPALNLTLTGDPLCFLLTDLPPAKAQAALQRLHQTYQSLCRMSGIPVGKNIWRGGLLVVLMTNERDSLTYVNKFFPNKNRGGYRTEEHWGTTHFLGEHLHVISHHFPADTAFNENNRLGSVVRSVTAAFYHRGFTTAMLPFWTWTAMQEFMGKSKEELARSAGFSAQRIVETGFLKAGYFEQAGRSGNGASSSDAALAVDVLNFLRDEKPKQFPVMFHDLLWGQLWETALKEHYDWTVDEMLNAYLKKRGIKDVQLTH